MNSNNSPSSAFRKIAGLFCVALALISGHTAHGDDTALVRSNSAKPYVLFIIDTSDSMNLELGTGNWHPLNGDYPESKIYRAKRALYEVFRDVDDVNFGFMTFDHDEVRVGSKHWLYGLAEPLSSPWPLLYPVFDSDGSVDVGDDVFTLGKHLQGVPGSSAAGSVAGSCNNPLSLTDATDRAKINRFAKLGAGGIATTTLWVSQPSSIFTDQSTLVYQVQVSAPEIAAGNETLGDPTLTLTLAAARVDNCNSDPSSYLYTTKTVQFRRLGEFLMADTGDRFDDGGKKKSEEGQAGFWGWHDVQSESSCSDKSPFSGKGLESNYDDPFIFPPFTPAGFSPGDEALLTEADQYCVSTASGPVCRNLKFRTFVDSVYPEFRELDRGDFLPYHWKLSNKNDFLRRVNPKHLTGEPPDYGVASYFTDSVDPATQTLALKNPLERPLITTGPTPFGKAVNDYRCWYLGPNVGPAGKCRDRNSTLSFETGWQQVADGRDPDYLCRRPYVILISDGEDTCGGENVSADINDFDNRGVRTWILNVGGDKAEQSFNNILANANATLITVNQGDQLADELRDILGEINTEARAFATAAVPSVQTESDDKILLTSFNPLDNSSIWAGQSLAFLKPLPTKEEPAGSGRFVPDTSTTCSATQTSECFLWDAGAALKTQINAGDPVGPAVTQRRVYYSRPSAGAAVPMARQELEGRTGSGVGTAEERDLWQALEVPFLQDDVASEENARVEAKAILDKTYALKTGRLDPDDAATEITFVLGDTFHADPVVVGGPASNLLFSQDFEGYRDFSLKHRFRRKMLAVGANDGMVHFFDTGVARVVANEVKFDNGTGKEIAAFVPRAVMPKLRPLANGKSHLWSVDGSFGIADVHIDAVHAGAPVIADREWRTVLIAGLRRGGESVYALDITQPDELEEKTLPGPPSQTVVVPKSPGVIPDCHDRVGGGSALACDDELPFLSPLWEFRDTVEVDGSTYRLDEDDNGEFDLAFTWSKPNIGRIRVDEGGTVVDRFVAVFGGGLDPDKPSARGNWIYIVDIESGRAIYKQELVNPYDSALSGGAAASEPAAVDTNQDGLLDRIYIGTTGGFLYRIDLGPDSNGDPPALDPYNGILIEVSPGQFKVAPGVKRITDAARAPRVVFDNVNAATTKRLPFFFRPSVLFTPLLAPNYTLALGDGDREDLWSTSTTPGRFYVFADDTDSTPGIITAAQLESAPVGLAVGDFLFNPRSGNRNGWVLELGPNERVVSNAFALAGITVFTTYTPEDPDTVQDGDFLLCSRKGNSKVFAVLTTNANGVLFDANNNRTRSIGVNTLVGAAFADISSTKNAPIDGTPDPNDPPDELPPNRQLIFDELKKLFPSNCRFANYRIDIRAIASDTQVVEVAPVPVCVIEKNWREF